MYTRKEKLLLAWIHLRTKLLLFMNNLKVWGPVLHTLVVKDIICMVVKCTWKSKLNFQEWCHLMDEGVIEINKDRMRIKGIIE